jgi:hypothetical protein
MEHERGAFKVDCATHPVRPSKTGATAPFKADGVSNSRDRLPKICAGGLDVGGNCLEIKHFATEAHNLLA